jgi:histone deacetylase 1/2
LNVHGGQQQFGVNYFETYSPVVMWFSLCTLLTLSLLNGWHTRQIDFILAYPQAPIEFDMYMELPKGIEMADGSRKTHVLKLLKNLYGQKQAGRVWNQYLIKGLIRIGFQQSEIDECVFYRLKTIFVV